MDTAVFKQRMDNTIDRIKASRRRPGTEEILVGERSARSAERNRRLGVSLGPATISDLADLSERFGLSHWLRDAEVVGQRC